MDYRLEGEVAVVHLDDGKANAVSHELIDGLLDNLDKAEKEAKAVVLIGREGVFSGGFDLKEIGKGMDEAAALVNRGAHLMYRLFGYPLPLVAGCTGHAIAAGAFMLLSSDTRVAADGDFKIGLNETAIGMVLPVFGFELAKARLSKRHLTAAVVQAHLYSPEGAVDAGFVEEVVPADLVLTRCISVAEQLATLPQATYAGMKKELRRDALEKIEASLVS